jgi:hypothetical protein
LTRVLFMVALLLGTGGGRVFAESPAGVTRSPVAPSAEAVSAPDDAYQAAVTSCVKMWDRGTHMTKSEWLRTCRRVQDRLEHLPVR